MRHVFVSGQQVLSEGKLTLIDEDSLRSEASRIREQQERTAQESKVGDLEPFYRQMLEKANKTFCANWS